ncbi:MAG: hypothetical protein DMF97_20755 [Acidobacteria bacterium]|nr:MAG: hypothetical protein DMF97_20755 [Acidobacteriota bacterium]
MRLELPGLFDLQVNGFGGIDFNAPDLTSERAAEALDRMRVTGVTRCLPTLITSSFDLFARNARILAHMPSPAIAGIHMEGPYLSPEDGARGAHPREHLTPATLDDFNRRQDAANGRIALVTLAPEVTGAVALIERLVASGVRAAIGHTAATPREIADAVAAGATLATHLGNGCAQMLPRHPNVIWELLAADAVCVSLIVDGHHLPPATVKAMVRAKSPGRTILVTDAMAAAGCALRCRRRSPCVAGGDAVPRWIRAHAGSRDCQHRAVHGPADRRGDSDGIDDSCELSEYDDGRQRDR